METDRLYELLYPELSKDSEDLKHDRDINDILNIFRELKRIKETIYCKTEDIQSTLNYVIEENKPVVVVFFSDWHLGSIWTNYSNIVDVWIKTMEHSEVYVVFAGDIVDNFENLLFFQTVNSQIITPEKQKEILIKMFKILAYKKRLLVAVLGNHERYIKDFDEMLQSVPIAVNRIYFKIRVFLQEYKIAVVHKSKFSSNSYPIHSAFRELMMTYPGADIVVTAHTHVPGLCVCYYPQGEKILVKTGTFKNGLYENSFPEGLSPCVILYPVEKKVVPFMRLKDAIKTIKQF